MIFFNEKQQSENIFLEHNPIKLLKDIFNVLGIEYKNGGILINKNKNLEKKLNLLASFPPEELQNLYRVLIEKMGFDFVSLPNNMFLLSNKKKKINYYKSFENNLNFSIHSVEKLRNNLEKSLKPILGKDVGSLVVSPMGFISFVATQNKIDLAKKCLEEYEEYEKSFELRSYKVNPFFFVYFQKKNLDKSMFNYIEGLEFYYFDQLNNEICFFLKKEKHEKIRDWVASVNRQLSTLIKIRVQAIEVVVSKDEKTGAEKVIFGIGQVLGSVLTNNYFSTNVEKIITNFLESEGVVFFQNVFIIDVNALNGFELSFCTHSNNNENRSGSITTTSENYTTPGVTEKKTSAQRGYNIVLTPKVFDNNKICIEGNIQIDSLHKMKGHYYTAANKTVFNTIIESGKISIVSGLKYSTLVEEKIHRPFIEKICDYIPILEQFVTYKSEKERTTNLIILINPLIVDDLN